MFVLGEVGAEARKVPVGFDRGDNGVGFDRSFHGTMFN